MTPIIFDLDGTLIDSLPGITDAANAVLAEFELPSIGEDLTIGFVGRGERVFVERLIAATDLDPHAFELIVSRFVVHYKASASSTRLMPGVREALDILKQDGFSLGLVTNKPRAPLGPTLENVGLSDEFEVVLAGDDLERRKPDPLPLITAMKQMGGSRCIYVGDSDIDAETAQNAGMPFVLYSKGIRTKPIEEIPNDAVFDDFKDLLTTIKRLVG